MSGAKQDGKDKKSGGILRHPIKFLRLVNRSNLEMFFSTVHHSGFKVAISTTRSVFGNSMDDVRRAENREIYCEHQNEIPNYFVLPYYDNPLVSIIVPVYNQYRFTMACLHSILTNTKDVEYEVILGDDQSTDETISITDRVENLIIAKTETNSGFDRNCNNAAKKARGKYVLFLNNDTVVCDNWLKPLVDLIESSSDIGIVGSKLIYPDGLLQMAGGIICSDATARNYGKGCNPNEPQFNYVKEVDYICGASLMMPKALFDKVGGFDELYAPAYCEDSDICLAVRKLGYSVKYQPLSEVIHFEGMTHGKTSTKRVNPLQETNMVKFAKKWAPELRKDYCRPGLDLFHSRDRSMGRITVLFVTNHIPSDDLDSGNRMVFKHIEMLANMGYNVKLASSDFHYDPIYATPLEQMGVEVYYGEDFRHNWKKFAKEHKRDLDHIFIVGTRCADSFIKYLDKHTKAKIHYMTFNNPLVALEREYAETNDTHTLLTIKYLKTFYPRYLKCSDACTITSSIDAAGFSEHYPSVKIESIPFSAYTCSNPSEKEGKDLLYVGFLGSRADSDAMDRFIRNVMPSLRVKIPGCRLHIVGSMAPAELTDLESSDVIFEGHLTNDKIIELYSKSSVFINPIRFSSGICGNILDAMSYGVPVVSTSIGLEGLEGFDHPAFDDLDIFADEIARLINDREYAKQLIEKEQAYISAYFSPEHMKFTMDRLLG